MAILKDGFILQSGEYPVYEKNGKVFKERFSISEVAFTYVIESNILDLCNGLKINSAIVYKFDEISSLIDSQTEIPKIIRHIAIGNYIDSMVNVG